MWYLRSWYYSPHVTQIGLIVFSKDLLDITELEIMKRKVTYEIKDQYMDPIQVEPYYERTSGIGKCDAVSLTEGSKAARTVEKQRMKKIATKVIPILIFCSLGALGL